MATVNFMLTSPIAVDGDMNVTETKMVMRVNELFQELRQISGVQVAMSDIGYADGTDYCATVSVKNQWYASAVQLRRVAEQFDSQYRGREYADVGHMKYYTDLAHLEQVKISGFCKDFNELVYMTTEGRDRVENALGVEFVRLPVGTHIDYYNQHNSLFRIRVQQFNGELKAGYIDKYGMPVVKAVYDEITAPDYKGICCASFLGKKGLVATGDRQLIPFVYNEIKGANLDLLRNPQSLDKEVEKSISIFSENGHILAEKATDAGQRWGVIDRDNKVVIPFEFEALTEVYADDTRYAKYGLLIAERDGKFGMVDNDGSVAVPFEYDYLGLHDRDNPQLGRVDDGYLFAYKDGKVGIIDVNHRIAVPFRYSPEEIYQFEYPQIRFSVRPVSKNEIECQADLSRLEELCKRQNWTYEWSAVIQVRQDGADSMNKLVQHFKKISESSLPEAIAIWEKHALGRFPVPSIELSEEEQKVFRLDTPRESDIYLRPEERTGVYIPPQERVDSLIEKIRDAEAVRSEISHYSYHDMCVAALEGGFFEPDGGEYNRNKERQLAEIGREIDALYEQLDRAEANVRKFAPPLERRKDILAPTTTLYNIEQGIKEKMSKPRSSPTCEQKM